MFLQRKPKIKMVNVIKKFKVFLESVTKTVFYVRCTPSNSNVGPLTLPLTQALIHTDSSIFLTTHL